MSLHIKNAMPLVMFFARFEVLDNLEGKNVVSDLAGVEACVLSLHSESPSIPWRLFRCADRFDVLPQYLISHWQSFSLQTATSFTTAPSVFLKPKYFHTHDLTPTGVCNIWLSLPARSDGSIALSDSTMCVWTYVSNACEVEDNNEVSATRSLGVGCTHMSETEW